MSFAITFDFPDADVHIWSGTYDLNFGGQIYEPSHGLIGISASGFGGSGENDSLTASIPIADSQIRELLLRNFRQATCTLTWIYQNQANARWEPTGLKFTGKLANPKIQQTTYTVELQTFSQEQFVENKVFWNADWQQQHHEGDLGTEFMKKLAFEFKTEFPPRYFKS